MRVLTLAVGVLRAWWSRLRHLWSGEPTPYHITRAEEVPDTPEGGMLYVVGEGNHEWYAVMRCPCGCGESLVMSLLAGARPRWRVTVDEDGIPSLSPSVNRRVGCRSHFFLREGRIVWCER